MDVSLGHIPPHSFIQNKMLSSIRRINRTPILCGHRDSLARFRSSSQLYAVRNYSTYHPMTLTKSYHLSHHVSSFPLIQHTRPVHRSFSSVFRDANDEEITELELEQLRGLDSSIKSASAMLRYGEAPKFDSLLVIPSDFPIMPGFTYEFPLFQLPTNIVIAIESQIEQKRPFGLVALKKDSIFSSSTQATASPLSDVPGAIVPNEESVVDMNVIDPTPPPPTRTPTNQVESKLDLNSVYDVGTQVEFTISGSKLIVGAHRRVKMLSPVSEDTNLPYCNVEYFDEPTNDKTSADGAVLIAYFHEIHAIAKTLMASRQHMLMKGVDIGQRAHFVDIVASRFVNSTEKLQEVLATFDLKRRYELVLELLVWEQDRVKTKSKIAETVTENHLKLQHRHVAKEKKKAIDLQLNEGKTEKDMLHQTLLGLLKNKTVPKDVMTVIREEINRLLSMEPEQMEFTYTRNYLDWLTQLPWGIYTPEVYSVSTAEKVLNEDHYGLEEIKDRILQIVASARLLGSMPQGKIICFVGPPGVGKTSIARSIARALGRKYYRFSVGGLDDVAEIKGHRRTYVGAQPGKIIQCLKQTDCFNPVFLIDEIDKIGNSYRGDPAAALLEVIDPEQNKEFIDQYLDVPVDLSRFIILCTANSMDPIPPPLADRMQFIHVSGYISKEKLNIARQYLEPDIRTQLGLGDDKVQLTEEAINYLIRNHAREAGVRSLRQLIEKIYGNAALKIVREESIHLPIVVGLNNLPEFVGKPEHSTSNIYEDTPVGVATGLAWSTLGGSCIYVECTIADHKHRTQTSNIANASQTVILPSESLPTDPNTVVDMLKEDDEVIVVGKGELFCTGQLGDVMKESSSIAYTVAKRMYSMLKPHSAFFHNHRLHLHVPSGATPKDGPSAGITMVSSLLSVALNTPLAQGIGMTGELSLTGRVLPIGGVREKTLACVQAQLHTVILPKENEADFAELPTFLKEAITPHFVEHYDEVFCILFSHYISAHPESLAALPNVKHSQQFQIQEPESASTFSSRSVLPPVENLTPLLEQPYAPVPLQQKSVYEHL